MNITTLPENFIGTGEVKGHIFDRVESGNRCYVYHVETPEGKTYYEVVMRTKTPVCIDFEKRIYSETDFKETYPKSRWWGTLAWTHLTIEAAMERFNRIESEEVPNN